MQKKRGWILEDSILSFFLQKQEKIQKLIEKKLKFALLKLSVINKNANEKNILVNHYFIGF
jgi:hypothetical protein